MDFICDGNISVSLEDLHLRKPFKSSCIIDQHTLDRQTLPSALAECYASCDPPPNLDALNPYRDDKKNALRLAFARFFLSLLRI